MTIRTTRDPLSRPAERTEPKNTEAKPAPAAAPVAAPRGAPANRGYGVPLSSFEKMEWARQHPVAGVRESSRASTASAAEPVKRKVNFIFDAGPHAVMTDLRLKGSWDASGAPSSQWTEGIAMRPLGDGRWVATVELVDDGSGQELQWGVTADAPGRNDAWAVFGESNLKFKLGEGTRDVTYAPTTYHRMGVQKQGDRGIRFDFWAPNAKSVAVKIQGEDGRIERLPMTRNEDGTWTASNGTAWKRLLGKSYVYEVVASNGEKVERTDPYARVLMGEQRGVSRFYVNPQTGQETHKFVPGRLELMRFEIDDEPKATEAYLVLRDSSGKQLTRAQLLERLGPFDPALISSARNGQFNDLWSQNVTEDGRIRLVNAGGSFTALVNNPQALAGLKYELRAYAPDAGGKLKLIDDRNKDGKLSRLEQARSGYNDPWSNELTATSGQDFRGGVISDTRYQFKYDGVPRERDRSKWVVYQLHLGSFAGNSGNTNRSTLEDALQKLDYVKSLGVNTVEILPANENEGNRDWGYMGANSMAVESGYGFEDENGRWVTGDEAMKRFIDEAHRRGLNVINDVVYNHVGGDHNDLYNLDGPENPWFNWATEPGKFEKRDTDWGAMPAYNNPKVRQFFVDHAVAQVTDYHFDGLRFDFTQPMKGPGGKDGWDMMREMNRALHFVNPDVFTMAEQFDYDPAMTEPAKADGTGGGFDAQWYTEYQHRLVNDPGNPGLVQAAANGQRTNIDGFMNLLTNPRGLNSWTKAVSMISNHDEVGNALRTIDVADGPGQQKVPDQWARAAARFTAGMGFTGPGMPMFFQGDESLASNNFKWGTPSTWDLGWDWQQTGQHWDWSKLTFNDGQRQSFERLMSLSPADRQRDPAYQGLRPADRQVFEDLAKLTPQQREQQYVNIHRRQTFEFYKAAIALRQSSPAFSAGAEVQRVYTHNDDSVLAFTRKSGNEEFLVVGSLNRQNLEGYRMNLPPGQWQEVFNSDGAAFGGNNFGNYGGRVPGGDSRVNIPSGGYVVLKKVG